MKTNFLKSAIGQSALAICFALAGVAFSSHVFAAQVRFAHPKTVSPGLGTLNFPHWVVWDAEAAT